MSQSARNATDPANLPPRPSTRIAVLIVAAGRGQRAGEGLPKQYRLLGGKMVLSRSIAAFACHPAIHSIHVVINPDDRALYDTAAANFDIAPPIKGGATRQGSVHAGLMALADEKQTGAPPDLVLIHDAARCFVRKNLIDRVIAACDAGSGAIPALAVTDTLKRGDGGQIIGTVSRDQLWRAQTPQGFPFQPLLKAHQNAALAGEEMTDDAAIAEAAGLPVRLTEGDEENIKLTTPADFARYETQNHEPRTLEPRTGLGFDVHRFEPGDHLWLCGIRIAHSAGLKGHSDADVGLHALTDAILGALADGDIGHHFPPDDPQWKGASSDRFLAHAGGLVRAASGRISHCDITLICERPKIGPHMMAMRQKIADTLDLDIRRISVKATTTEGLGFTGRREGIAAQATATVLLPAPD
ncbi:bifunctional enzyme IspD/IspF [Iodidimonas nitroreducens]|uniref:Bifunctional enzyme IspD/IspF n=1 Tax=Iodidimonas nitroreducens TaxID=1236968 RepID=A0A5A7N6P9_9PROT|nr:bifunctional 2-C-methyl-D-erythritol 4-phosphate cytidylyltransferase/2-C-methyl-D-erythritol 2,4-cyclodiphosphate synthase [Iodidimonas nitroreducens]GAK32888.1 bifunctional enzyme IspD/IspF [alpha proteobacterium Q-1]GER03050.1 bifunctional enzyme IspD/IspF [Iodidimonas nitroreducens]